MIYVLRGLYIFDRKVFLWFIIFSFPFSSILNLNGIMFRWFRCPSSGCTFWEWCCSMVILSWWHRKLFFVVVYHLGWELFKIWSCYCHCALVTLLLVSTVRDCLWYSRYLDWDTFLLKNPSLPSVHPEYPKWKLVLLRDFAFEFSRIPPRPLRKWKFEQLCVGTSVWRLIAISPVDTI